MTTPSALIPSALRLLLPNLDVSYSGYDSYLPSAVSAAQAAGKKLIVEEWGSLVGSGRDSNLQSNVDKINSYGVPWLYWELITNNDPGQGQDYEVSLSIKAWCIN